MPDQDLDIQPLTTERWKDLEILFGPHGAYSGCWCMFWRVRHADFNRMKSEERKAALQELSAHDPAPGLLAYAGGLPVGWVSLGPREDFAALAHSRSLAPLDDTPVWSIVCFFVARSRRRKGLLTKLIRGAVQYAREHNAAIVEAYPADMQSYRLKGVQLSGYSGYMGIASAFRAAGFVAVKQVTETQVIMRCQDGGLIWPG
jgi:GNAT superfamily N-acetyltransferase